MSSEDLFTAADKKKQTPVKTKTRDDSARLSNVPEMSVSDLALSLKQTLEQTYGRVRIRGELSGLKLAASGHLYGDIKDVDANINIICWRGTMSKLSIKPEDGMDVVVTGRVSSYPKSSRYQIIIESLELAGEGALLKMLEERRKKLAAEGLFDPARKQKLPFLPKTIGVVTSPTGAVIRDIMHRLKDRFPRHVLVWPVNVQGDGANVQITAAINGFNQLDETDIPCPDLLIVARGGGSLEDLMAFNEENVVRAVADSTIPIISAVGHETDTTLVDYASDLRAPTPTGAAEMAVPMRMNLIAQVQDDYERLISAAARLIGDQKNILAAQSAKLNHPAQILENKAQSIDYITEKLKNSAKQVIQDKQSQLQKLSLKLTSPQALIDQKTQNLAFLTTQIQKTIPRTFDDRRTCLEALNRMLISLSPKGVLSRGYALIYDDQGNLVRQTAQITNGQEIQIEFSNNDKMGAKAGKPLKS